MKRIRDSEVRDIDGTQVTVNTVEEMDYQGTGWTSYEIVVDGKVIDECYGWPTNSDLRGFLEANKAK